MRTRNMVRKFCEGCIKALGWTIMTSMGIFIFSAIGYAFWQLILQIIS